MTDVEPAAAPPDTPDAECLLPPGAADATDCMDADLSDAAQRVLAYEQSDTTAGFNAAPILPCQRTRLLVTTAGNYPDDVVFAHTSV